MRVLRCVNTMESDCIHDQLKQNSFYLQYLQFTTMDFIKRRDLRHVLLLFQHKALFACAYHSLPVE
jgi:hypothetical protein